MFKCGADVRMFERVKCGEILWRSKMLVDWLGSRVRVSASNFRFFLILPFLTSVHVHYTLGCRGVG